MRVKLILQGECNDTFRTDRNPFDTKKFLILAPEILVEWILPAVSVVFFLLMIVKDEPAMKVKINDSIKP